MAEKALTQAELKSLRAMLGKQDEGAPLPPPKPDPAVQRKLDAAEKAVTAARDNLKASKRATEDAAEVLQKATKALAALTSTKPASTDTTNSGDKVEVWVEVKDALIGTDGSWMQLELEEGQRVRIVHPSARGKVGLPGARKPRSGGNGRVGQGPVTFEMFEYEDESIKKEVQRQGQSEWVPAQPGMFNDVVATRVVDVMTNQPIATGFPSAPPGMFVKMAFRQGATDIMNVLDSPS